MEQFSSLKSEVISWNEPASSCPKLCVIDVLALRGFALQTNVVVVVVVVVIVVVVVEILPGAKNSLLFPTSPGFVHYPLEKLFGEMTSFSLNKRC